jgi:hypothetical protein
MPLKPSLNIMIINMKRIVILILGGLLLVAVLAFAAIRIWIGNEVKENIALAEEKYPGTAEEALIAFLRDENNSPRERTFIAVWTLGQIQSEKALPDLQEFYKDDPKGNTCYGKHDSVLCQYEIHKAMASIEGRRLFIYARFR